MADNPKLDMSLDDIIKLNSSHRERSGPRRSGHRFRRGDRDDDDNNDDDRRQGGRQNRQERLGSVNGGVNNTRINRRRDTHFRKQEIRELPDVWKHDLFDDDSEPPRQSRGSTTTRGSAKLLISNLDFGVSESDIQELFSEFGPLIKAEVNFDRSGRSRGTAEVIYVNNSDAAKAMKQYNNVPLDGRPMQIQFVGSRSPERTYSPKRTDPRSRLGDRLPTFPTRRRNFESGRRGGRRNDRKLPTVEDLDAQLDAYSAKMEVD